jgi:hypothetical protein
MSENQDASTRTGVTLSQAAAHFGISEKTLRKRIHAGDVRAEKLPLDGGGVGWMVFLDERAGSETETAPEVGTERAGSAPEVFSTVTEARRNIAPEVTVTRAGTVPEVEAMLRDALEVSRANEAFLRGLIEQRDRSIAELMSAHRKALDAMPKQITGADVELRNATPQTPVAETSPASQPTRRAPRSLLRLILGLR